MCEQRGFLQMKADEIRQILAYYARGGEAQRLQHGIGLLERARTQELLRRYLPPAPAVIYDIGGGTGSYAFWLAEQDYAVHLLEFSPENVRQAQETNRTARNRLASIEIAEARNLPRPASSADAVLLLGPLYHLPEQAERLQALAEAHRVLKPGGFVAAAVISRFASSFWALSIYGPEDWLLGEPDIQAMLAQELETGQHLRQSEHPGLFTRAYYHLPGDLAAELKSAGLHSVEVLPVEGPGWIVPDFEAVWSQPNRRDPILDLVRHLERYQEIAGMSPHLLGLGKKPL